MLKTRLSFILLFLFINIFSQNDSLVKWNKEIVLTINDFSNRKVDSLSTVLVAELACEINIENYISCEDSDRIFFSVYAYNNKDKSWIYTEFATKSLLEHEQIHFDICEMSARKIRKKLLNKYINVGYVTFDDFDHIINDEISFLNLYQVKYDFETAHGVEEIKQKEWKEKIKNELAELEKYSFENYKQALCIL